MTTMASNTFKLKPQKKESLFARLDRSLRMGRFFEEGMPVRYLPHVAYVTLLLIIYIGYNHYVEKTTREINKLQIEVENLRTEYTTLKSQYMYARLQSEVARRVADRGLQESKVPPKKIVIAEK